MLNKLLSSLEDAAPFESHRLDEAQPGQLRKATSCADQWQEPGYAAHSQREKHQVSLYAIHTYNMC